MASVIKIKHNDTASAVPADGQLAKAELAINLADKKLFSSTNGTDIIEVAGATADTLTDARNIAVSGVVSGNASFDGSQDIDIVTSLSGGITIAYNDKIEFTGAGEGQVVYNAMNLRNNNIIGVNNLKINDAGDHEGVEWPNWKIFESPNPFDGEGVDGNQEGNFQIAYENGNNNWETRFEVKPTGADVTGSLTLDNKIGVGTDNPSNQLTLKSTSAGDTSGIRWDNGNDSVKAYFNTGDAESDFFLTYVGTNNPEIKLQHDGDIVLNGGSSNGNILLNTGSSTGKVGVGKTAPSEALDVSGNVKATEVIAIIDGGTY